MKLLITAKECDDTNYHHLYDLEEHVFIENGLDRELDPPSEDRFDHILPTEFAPEICLRAFIHAVRSLHYESALDLLKVSYHVRRHISDYFGANNMTKLIKLTRSVNDELMQARRGTDHITSIDFMTLKEGSTQPYEIEEDETEVSFYESEILWDLKTFYTGPTLLDVAMIHGYFSNGICVAKILAYPYILIKIKSPDSMEQTVVDHTFISYEWMALAKIFCLIFGKHCKLCTFVRDYPADRLFFIPSSIDGYNL